MRKYSLFAFIALASGFISSCSDKSDEPDDPTMQSDGSVYVLNQGNFYNGIEGGLTVIDLDKQESSDMVFKRANGRSIGDTPQCGVAYGSKIYIGTYESKTIEIIDKSTFKSIKQIKLTDNPANGTEPYSMLAYDGRVYISMYDGFLARLDTLTLDIDKSVKVGQNPDQIALSGGLIYVPVSEGMNYPDYGTTACSVDPESMTVRNVFKVGLNPTNFFTAGGRLFLLCKGNYSDVKGYLYEVDRDYNLTQICEASLAASYGDKVAVVNQPWTDGTPKIDYKLYDTASRSLTDWNFAKPDYVNAIFYDESAGKLILSSYVMNGIYPSYDVPGYINVYHGETCNLEFKAPCGAAGPSCIFTTIK